MPKGKKTIFFVLLVGFVILGWFSTAQISGVLKAEARTPYQDLQLFTDVLSIVRQSYVEEVETQDLIHGAVNGMLNSLDPHSAYLPPDMFREMQIDTSGEFGGLGIEVTIKDGILTIVSPIEDTPAYRAGLEAGDQILKIDDRMTQEMTIMDAVKLMRGPEGSPITITIMRESFEKPQEITLEREIIKVQSVKARTLEDGFGYIRLAQFQDRTQRDLEEALAKLHEGNGNRLTGLILDLRNNPGGLLDQAVQVADAFLSEGLIVYTEGREPGSRMRFSAHADGTEPDYPLVVLINSGSASGAEIVAGALQDHRRGIVMGTQSFGKGSVQTIIPLGDDSGLRLTTARYFTPSGRSIQARGILPDIEVHPMKVQEPEESDHFREKDLQNHFEAVEPDDRERSEGTLHFRLNGNDREDYQLMRALDLLKGLYFLTDRSPQAA